MDYFSGNHFSMAGVQPGYTSTHRHVPLYYGIQYNHAGGVCVRVNDGPAYEEKQPCVFITQPGVMIEYGPIDHQPRDHHFICFHGPRIKSYVDSGLLPLDLDPPLLRIHYPELFRETMTDLIEMINGVDVRQERMVLKLEDLMLQIHEQKGGEQAVPHYQLPHFKELIQAVGDQPELPWDFGEEAERLSITATHFRRLFKRCCDMSPQQFLIHHRLRKAAQLLVTTQLQVGVIAGEVGIGSEFYFSRLFKKRHHVSPLKYRKEFKAPLE